MKVPFLFALSMFAIAAGMCYVAHLYGIAHRPIHRLAVVMCHDSKKGTWAGYQRNWSKPGSSEGVGSWTTCEEHSALFNAQPWGEWAHNKHWACHSFCLRTKDE